MHDGVDKPDAGEATAQTKTDPDEVDFEGLSTLDEPVSETIVSPIPFFRVVYFPVNFEYFNDRIRQFNSSFPFAET